MLYIFQICSFVAVLKMTIFTCTFFHLVGFLRVLFMYQGRKLTFWVVFHCFDHLNAIHMVLSKDSQTIQLSVLDLLNPCVIVWNRHIVE